MSERCAATCLRLMSLLLFALLLGVPSLQAQSPSTRTFINSIGMEFVRIPAGTFVMGSEKGEPDEQPPHQVTISKPFYMAKYEVTQAQWQRVMGNKPSLFGGDPNLPVEQVWWSDVQDFIHKLNEMEGGNTYRLPTEAEWEYAARAGTTTTFSFGDNASELGQYAWYKNNSGDRTHPVGQLKPNPWGLYDIYGNVMEWVLDWYGKYSSEAVTDPQGPAAGTHRMRRGGAWNNVAKACRSANRYSVPGFRDDFLGFRPVRMMP